jgi:hypothetical protein
MSGKFLAEHETYHSERHGSKLLKCPLKAYFDRANPKLDIQTMIRFKNGLFWDDYLKGILSEEFGETKIERAEFEETIFSPDYARQKWIAELKFTESLPYGKPRTKDIDQLSQYCAVNEINEGFLIYVTLNHYNASSGAFEPDLLVFKFTFTNEQLAELRTLIKNNISQYTLIFSILDEGGELDPSFVATAYKWECRYCDHTIKCESIKKQIEEQNMPYRKVEFEGEEYRDEFPETFRFKKPGDTIEGVLLAKRDVEFKNSRTGKMDHTTVYEIETASGKVFSIWGGRKDFDNKIAQVTEGQQIRVTMLDRKDTNTQYIPYSVEIWED